MSRISEFEAEYAEKQRAWANCTADRLRKLERIKDLAAELATAADSAWFADCSGATSGLKEHVDRMREALAELETK